MDEEMLQAVSGSVSIDDVYAAAERIAPYLPETPLVQHPAFADSLGVDAWLKLETAQPTGAFKVRGGVNFMAAQSAELRTRGVVTASTGNHGQSIAYAARLFGVPATIYAPKDANPFKVDAMRVMQAEVRLVGEDFQASVDHAVEAARIEGRRFISTGDEPLLIAGVATCALEAFRRRIDCGWGGSGHQAPSTPVPGDRRFERASPGRARCMASSDSCSIRETDDARRRSRGPRVLRFAAVDHGRLSRRLRPGR